jgi:hypothetical protein
MNEPARCSYEESLRADVGPCKVAGGYYPAARKTDLVEHIVDMDPNSVI